MDYNFLVGFYVETLDGRVGYIQKIQIERGRCKRYRYFMTVRFSDDAVLQMEYTNLGVFVGNDYYKYEDFFRQIGRYEFSKEEYKIKKLPYTKKIVTNNCYQGEVIEQRVTVKDIPRNEIIDKINEIIEYIN